jgi:hypothetical protein
VVILASNTQQTVGVLARDILTTASTEPIALRAAAQESTGQQALRASPNPFSSHTTLSFALPADGEYALTLYDSKQGQQVYYKQGKARAGERKAIEIDGAPLARGLYLARLQTAAGTQSQRLLLDR